MFLLLRTVLIGTKARMCSVFMHHMKWLNGTAERISEYICTWCRYGYVSSNTNINKYYILIRWKTRQIANDGEALKFTISHLMSHYRKFSLFQHVHTYNFEKIPAIRLPYERRQRHHIFSVLVNSFEQWL